MATYRTNSNGNVIIKVISDNRIQKVVYRINEPNKLLQLDNNEVSTGEMTELKKKYPIDCTIDDYIELIKKCRGAFFYAEASERLDKNNSQLVGTIN